MPAGIPISRMPTRLESVRGTRWPSNTAIRSSRPGADQHAALDAILSKAQSNGLYFITDQDSRPLGGAHPYSHLWDNGPDPAAELDRILKVRAAALDQFGENAIPMGVPMAEIEDTLVPLYLLHRYQTEAAAKEVGGLNYRYALRGDGQTGDRDCQSGRPEESARAR